MKLSGRKNPRKVYCSFSLGTPHGESKNHSSKPGLPESCLEPLYRAYLHISGKMKYGSLEWFFSNGGLYLSNKAGAVSKLDFYSYNRLYSVDNAIPSGFLDQIFKRVSNFWEFALTQSVLSLANDFHSEWLYSIFNIFNIKNIQYSVFVFLLSRYQTWNN